MSDVGEVESESLFLLCEMKCSGTQMIKKWLLYFDVCHFRLKSFREEEKFDRLIIQISVCYNHCCLCFSDL